MKRIINKIQLIMRTFISNRKGRILLKEEIQSLIVELIGLIDKLIKVQIYKEDVHDRTMFMYIEQLQKCKTVSEFTQLKLEILNSIKVQEIKLKEL